MNKKVLITCTGFSQFCEQGKTLLLQHNFEILEPCIKKPFLTFEQLQKVMPSIDAVIAGLDIWNQDVFEFSKKLKIIARFGLGTDNVDLKAARAHGIHVTNARASFNAVAELAIALILACLRKTPILDAGIRSGKWERFVGDELCQKTIGLVGFGKISQTLAKRLSGFDVNLTAYDPFPNLMLAKELNVTLLPLDELLANSDIVSLHIPATLETIGSVNRHFFNKCKTGACLINTARGSLVNEQDLFDALQSKKLKAAASDVFTSEPVSVDNPLLKLENFFATPHQGAETLQTLRDVGLICAQSIVQTFSGDKVMNLVN